MCKNCAGPVQFSMQELCRFQASNLSRITAQVLRVSRSLLSIFFGIFKNAKQYNKNLLVLCRFFTVPQIKI